MSNGHDPGVDVHALPVDPDTSATSSDPRPTVGAGLRGRGDILLAIAVGGALGSLARWSLAEALPHGPGTSSGAPSPRTSPARWRWGC